MGRVALVRVSALLALTAACAPAPDTVTTTAPIITNRNLDILFVIDTSSSMRLSQATLEANFPLFMNVLENLPGGLPNIHVAVISTDMGAGDGSISGCTGTGNSGIFQYTARGACTDTTLAPGATFISNVNGVKNYTAADISDVFSCIAALGESGCGFEHQFASVMRALGADGVAAPAENAGFLRQDALLAIVMVTNEDDCSARPGIPLFDATSNLTLASQLGPVTNFRCNEFGHVCNGAAPSRLAPTGMVTDTVTLTGCTSSGCGGLLTPVAEFTARIKALKVDPAKEILVAAITGPTTPYEVHWKNPSTTDTGPWPEISHSCTAQDGSFADPAVRISEWVSAFGPNGFVSSICEPNFMPALQIVANRIGTLLDAGGGTGGSGGGPIPTCEATGFGGRGGSGGSGGAGGSGAGGAAGVAGAGGAAGAAGAGATGAGGAGGAAGGAAGAAGGAAGAAGGAAGAAGGAAGAAGGAAGAVAGAGGSGGRGGVGGAAGSAAGAAGAAGGAAGAAGGAAGAAGGAGGAQSSDAGATDGGGPGSGGSGTAGASGSAGAAGGAAGAAGSAAAGRGGAGPGGAAGGHDASAPDSGGGSGGSTGGDDGCGCQTTGGQAAQPLALAAGLVMASLASRRRRRRLT